MICPSLICMNFIMRLWRDVFSQTIELRCYTKIPTVWHTTFASHPWLIVCYSIKSTLNPLDHPLYYVTNKEVLDQMKDECMSRQMMENCSLKARMYIHFIVDGQLECKKAKWRRMLCARLCILPWLSDRLILYKQHFDLSNYPRNHPLFDLSAKG